jgi:hypothetical protein
MTEATAFAASSLETQGGLLGGVMARGVDWRVDAGGVDVMSGCVDTHHTTARARGRGRVGVDEPTRRGCSRIQKETRRPSVKRPRCEESEESGGCKSLGC